MCPPPFGMTLTKVRGRLSGQSKMPSKVAVEAVVVAVAAVAEEAVVVVVVVEIITAAVEIMAVAKVAVAEDMAVAITTTMATMATTMATMATMAMIMVTIITMTGTSMKPHPMEARMAMRASSRMKRNKRLSLNLLLHLAMETKEARLAIASAGVRTANEKYPFELNMNCHE